MSIATKLDRLNTIKQDIKSALEEKGQTPSNNFTTYADEIRNIQVGGGLSLPKVKNLVISDDYIATWEEPDITEIENAEIEEYVVYANGWSIATKEKSLDLKTYLVSNDNLVDVVAKIKLNSNSNPKNIEYTKPTQTLETLSATLEKGLKGCVTATKGKNIYVLSGANGTSSSNYTKLIRVFDTESETLTTLSGTTSGYCMIKGAIKDNLMFSPGGEYGYNTHTSTIYVYKIEENQWSTFYTSLPAAVASRSVEIVGDYLYHFGGYSYSNGYSTKITRINVLNGKREIMPTETPNDFGGTISVLYKGTIYLFGGNNSSVSGNKIHKYDVENDTLTKLSTTIPNVSVTNDIGAAAVGDYIYLFGGNSNSGYSNKILQFDPSSETITTLNITLEENIGSMGIGVVGNKVYLFGGYGSGYSSKIKKITL